MSRQVNQGRFSGSDAQTSDVYNWFAPQADILVMFCRDLICRAEHKNRVLDRPIHLVAFRLCRLVSNIFEDVRRPCISIGEYIFELDLIGSDERDWRICLTVQAQRQSGVHNVMASKARILG